MTTTNEHVLNFHTDSSPTIPEWFPARSLSLIVGAGDLDHGGVLNVKAFADFDVFLCNAWDNNGSYQRNIEYLQENFYHQKLICVLDMENEKQRERFVTLFSDKFHLIDGHGGHTPHFSCCDLQRLLVVQGKAMNIYETSENLMHMDEILGWFELGYFKRGYSDVLITSRIYKDKYTLSKEDEEFMHGKFLEAIVKQYTQTKNMLICVKGLDSLPLRTLQHILYSLTFDRQMGINLIGDILSNKRIWTSEATVELVLTKIQPDYQPEKVAKCKDTKITDRIAFIIKMIEEDLKKGFILGSVCKFRTLNTILSSEKFELACSPEYESLPI